MGEQLPQRHRHCNSRIAQAQIGQIFDDRRIQLDLMLIDQLSDAERGERFRDRADVEERRCRDGSVSRQISKTVSLLQHNAVIFDQCERRTADVSCRHEIEHQSIGGGKVRRRRRRAVSRKCDSYSDRACRE